jgi:two-component system, NarL family, nitrate/nitrite response regulator NarL
MLSRNEGTWEVGMTPTGLNRARTGEIRGYEGGLDLSRDRGEGFDWDADIPPREAGLLAAKTCRLRIVIVSDVRFRREILAEFLERDASVMVVGVCADLAEVVAMSAPLQADLVLVDAEIRDGFAAARRTRQIRPDIRLIAYPVRETRDDVIAWAEAGVMGYIPNTAASADLVRLIVDIHGGQQPCSGRVAAELLRRIAATESLGDGRNPPSPACPLTRREREAAELIAAGLSDKQIARQLNISLATAKLHVHNLLGKLNVQRRGQVVARMHEYAQHPGRARLDPTGSSSGSTANP